MDKYKNNTIENILSDAAERFSKTLNKFHPAYDNNAFNESNLTFQFAHSFLKRANSNAIIEVPAWNEKNKKHDRRIDAYLFDNKVGIFLESKRFNSLPDAKGVCRDLLKLNPYDLKYILNELHISTRPPKIFILVLLETWKEFICEWWEEEKSINSAWKNLDFPIKKICYRKRHIKTWDDKGSLHWLYGYKQIKI